MRILVTDKKTSVAGLRDQLLSTRLSAGQADAAFTSLQKVNPHVDLTNLAPGTVLFVPDTPDFQEAGSDAVSGDVVADFEHLVKTALDAAVSRGKAAGDARAAESADVTRTFKSAAFKRVLASNTELQSDVEAANAALKSEKEAREAAEATVAAASKGALAALRALSQNLRVG